MEYVIYDPRPSTNDYLSVFYLEPLFAYMNDRGMNVKCVRTGLETIRNSKVLIDATNLGNQYPVTTDEKLAMLKNNGNQIFCFDINDHSSLGFNGLNLDGIDFLFKVAGIQNDDECQELLIDSDCGYRLEPKRFLPEGSIEYNEYKKLKDTNRIMSLPYIMNDNDVSDGVSYEHRNKKCLVRGGAHFKRVHLFYNLLRLGLADDQSAFHVREYQHMMCGDCVNTVCQGSYSYDHYKAKQNFNCNNPAIKWCESDLPQDFFNVNRWGWNNRCHPMYYWLMEKFSSKHGHIDPNVVSKVLNNENLSSTKLSELIGNYMFYGDFKWIFSIYAPQRFWAAARCKTINLLPDRAAAQSYFPEITNGNHFITFKEDFSDLDKLNSVSKEQYEHITNNCLDLYNRYLKFDRYKLSVNLMNEILNKTER